MQVHSSSLFNKPNPSIGQHRHIFQPQSTISQDTFTAKIFGALKCSPEVSRKSSIVTTIQQEFSTQIVQLDKQGYDLSLQFYHQKRGHSVTKKKLVATVIDKQNQTPYLRCSHSGVFSANTFNDFKNELSKMCSVGLNWPSMRREIKQLQQYAKKGDELELIR